jgi:predicted negative regulator of RcsB-dependent stress response
VGQALEEAKSFLNQRQYEEAEKVLTAIKYNKVPEEFKLVGDIFLACAYSEQDKRAQLKAIVEVMKVNATFYISKPEFSELFGHMCAVCEKFEKEKE